MSVIAYHHNLKFIYTKKNYKILKSKTRSFLVEYKITYAGN